MNRFPQPLFASLLILWLTTASVFAQQDEQAPPTNAADTETTADQEVEINEDNYRQFMELKDALQQRTVLPENAYQSQAGLQKLDKLPETSQKHLRNQLRQVIVEGEAWKPGDENREYPFVPSAAAATDPALKKQETEAWGELIDGYHAREAEIHANATRSRAAAAAGSFAAGGMGDKGDSTTGEESQPGEVQAGESPGQKQAGQAGREGGFSPGAQNASNTSDSDGTSQNALEFLKQQGALQTPTQAGQSPDGQMQGSPGGRSQAEGMGMKGQQAVTQNQGQQPGSEPGKSTAQTASQQTDSQQDDTGEAGSGQSQQQVQQQAEQWSEQSNQSAQQQGESARQTDQAGAEQTQQTAAQAENRQKDANDASFPVTASDSAEDGTEGVSQNALEFLMQQNSQELETAEEDEPQGGTLTIQDLVNVRGTSVEAGFGAEDNSDTDKPKPGETPPKKDGDG